MNESYGKGYFIRENKDEKFFEVFQLYFTYKKSFEYQIPNKENAQSFLEREKFDSRFLLLSNKTMKVFRALI